MWWGVGVGPLISASIVPQTEVKSNGTDQQVEGELELLEDVHEVLGRGWSCAVTQHAICQHTVAFYLCYHNYGNVRACVCV